MTLHHSRSWTTAVAVMAVAGMLAIAAPATAQQWNDRTELTFSEPVMVPGATLQPGTYVFKLANAQGSRHLVQVLGEDGLHLITMTQAVPTRRPEPLGDAILKFNPTEHGIPAIKAWYHPNSTYGHEFVYSEEEARDIANRTRTIVLSIDQPGTDLSKGSLALYHPTGDRTQWAGDSEATRSYREWQQSRQADHGSDHGGPHQDENGDNGDDDAHPEAHAPMMMTDAPAMKVPLDELEENAAKYLDKTISVDAEVEKVYGPRLFTIDEPTWWDLDGEILVYAPSVLAALVSADDRVTVTGTLKNVAMAEIEREWGWFDLDPELEVEFMKKPVLVATRIVGGDNNAALFIDMDGAKNADSTAGKGNDKGGSEPAENTDASSGSDAGSTVIMDPALVGAGSRDLVGRAVDLKNIKVLTAAHGGGFFIDTPGGAVFVLPSQSASAVMPGATVAVRGVVAQAPRGMDERVNPPAGWNDRIYIVATSMQ